MIVLEVVLEPEDAEVLEAIAEKWGVSLEIVVTMACQKYVRQAQKDGLPGITGVGMRFDEDKRE